MVSLTRLRAILALCIEHAGIGGSSMRLGMVLVQEMRILPRRGRIAMMILDAESVLCKQYFKGEHATRSARDEMIAMLGTCYDKFRVKAMTRTQENIAQTSHWA